MLRCVASFLFDFLKQIDIVYSAQNKNKLNKKIYTNMKTKVFFLVVVVISLMNLNLSASVESLSLTGVQSGTIFNYCSTTVDSVIVYKPEGVGWCEFAGPGMGWTTVDSVIITVENQGVCIGRIRLI